MIILLCFAITNQLSAEDFDIMSKPNFNSKPPSYKQLYFNEEYNTALEIAKKTNKAVIVVNQKIIPDNLIVTENEIVVFLTKNIGLTNLYDGITRYKNMDGELLLIDETPQQIINEVVVKPKLYRYERRCINGQCFMIQVPLEQ